MQVDPCPCKRDAQGKCPCDPNQDIIAGAKSRLSNVLGFAGNTLFAGAQTGTPNPAMGALGGAIAGLSTGGTIGSIFGALDGLITTGQARSDFEQTQEDRNMRYIKDRTFMPEYAADGGLFSDKLQTEDGEVLVLPTLEISKVKATKKHKDMKPTEVTDIVPQGTVVFSNQKTIDLKKYKDVKLSDAVSFYDDNEVYEYGELTVGDVLGDSGKITFAEAAEKAKKYYPTTTEKNLVAEQTNELNLAARAPIIGFLFGVQSGEDINMKKETVPKAAKGWPNYKEMLKQLGLVDEEELEPGMTSFSNIPKNYTNPSPNLNPYNPYETIMDPSQVSVPALDPPILDRLPTLSGGVTSNAENRISLSPKDQTTQGASTTQAVNPAGISSSELSIKELTDYLKGKYGERRGELDTRFKKDQEDIASLIKRKNANNALQLGTQALFSGVQSGYSNPALESTSLIDDQFRDIPASLVDQEAQKLGAGANSTIQALSAAGLSPGDIARYSSGVTENVLNAQGDLRSKNLQLSNANNKGKIAAYRDVIQGNNQKLADSENKLRDFNNKRFADIGGFINNYLTDKNSIADAEYKLNKTGQTDYAQASGSINKAEDQLKILEFANKNNSLPGSEAIMNQINSLTEEEKAKLLEMLTRKQSGRVQPLPRMLNSVKR